MTYTCTGCGATKTETIAALGHKWDGGETTTEATCEKEGVKTFTCTVCNATRTEDIGKVDHNLGEDYKCSMCGNYFYPSLAEFNSKVTLENSKNVVVTVELDDEKFGDISYSENNSGYEGRGLLVGGTQLNHYNEKPTTVGDCKYVFRGGEITTESTGYEQIDSKCDDRVYMLLPAGSDVVFENVTFNGSVRFDIQMYSSSWDVLNSITFKDCVFNGIVIGYCPADNIVFDGCNFTEYKNTVNENNSNPIWMRSMVGTYSNGTGPHVSMHSITFKNNTVTSSRPVKFDRVGQPYTTAENKTTYYGVTITILDNTFDISKENKDNKENEFKNIGITIDKHDDNVAFTLVDDGNTKSVGTEALYTFRNEKFASGTKILDRDGNPKTLEYVTWKTNTVKTLESM